MMRSSHPYERRLRLFLLGWIYLVPGCVGTTNGDPSAPVFLWEHLDQPTPIPERVGRAPGTAEGALPAPVTFDRDTRRAIVTAVPSRLTFDVSIPEDPTLRFAVAASPIGRPDLVAPVEFRLTVDVGAGEQVCFAETLHRSEPDRWLQHEADLTPWAGERATLRLETGIVGGGPSTKNLPVVAFWANPILVNRNALPGRPTIVLISIDCLRADHLGAYGYPRDTSPNLDELTRQAVVFETAMSTSSYTHPTHMSMMTGLPPSLHGATRQRKLAEGVAYLPEVLSEKGYRVDGYVSGAFLSQDFGFERGFHSYRYDQDAGAKRLVDAAVNLLRRGRGQSQFLFLHVFDPHWPYLPPRDLRDRFGERPSDLSGLLGRVSQTNPPRTAEELEQMRLLYDGEIANVDRELGRLFQEMRRMGLFEGALIIVTADHGEAFMEHGYWEHAQTLHEEIVRVPLIVKWPRGPGGIRIDGLVSQADIFATILAAAGIDAENPWWFPFRKVSEALPRPIRVPSSPKSSGHHCRRAERY